MLTMYGHAWESQYGRTPNGAAQQTWEAAIDGLSNAQIVGALERCLTLGGEWPPSLPRFRAMALGIPPLARVMYELRPGSGWIGPFARYVWTFVDGHRLRHSDTASADRLLRDAYDLACEQVMSSMSIPEAPVPAGALPPPQEAKPIKATPEQAQRHIEAIARALRLSDAEVEEIGPEAMQAIADAAETQA